MRFIFPLGFPDGSSGKETACQSRRQRRQDFDPWVGRPPEEEIAAHSSILAWRIPWTEEAGGLQSMGSQRVGHDWSDLACTHVPSLLSAHPQTLTLLLPAKWERKRNCCLIKQGTFFGFVLWEEFSFGFFGIKFYKKKGGGRLWQGWVGMALYFFADLAENFQNLKKLFSFIKKYYYHAVLYKAFSHSKFDQRFINTVVHTVFILE